MTKTGGVLEVRLEETDLNEDDFLSYTSLKAGPYLKLSVKDTGHGISKENLERIFEPYFTTKDPGEGTGLGLAVTHGIVKDYGGAIKVYSEEGQGTIFHVLFPLIKEAGEVSSSESFAPLHIGTETIMLVDDEEMLVDVGTKILERLGYRVTGFTNPQEALDIFKNSKDSYDLIITDKTMPKMTGLDLATEIKKIRPDIPVLLCTGFQDRGIDDKLLKVGISEYVMKPLNRREMSVAVRKVLDKKTS
jgi:CheY-like chemotaxis protein